MDLESISQAINDLIKIKEMRLERKILFTDVMDIGIEKLNIDWNQVLTFFTERLPVFNENLLTDMMFVSKITDSFVFQEINDLASKPFHTKRKIDSEASRELILTARTFIPFVFMKGRINDDDREDQYYKIRLNKSKNDSGIEIIDKETYLTAKTIFIDFLVLMFAIEPYIETRPELVIDLYKIKQIPQDDFMNLKKVLSYLQLDTIRYDTEFVFSLDKTRSNNDLARNYITKLMKAKNREDILTLKENNENEIYLSGLEDHALLKIMQLEETRREHPELAIMFKLFYLQ